MEAYEYDLNKIQPFEMPTFHALHEGDVFELGNRRVECIEVAGHTPGGICFLDEATKILFSGDACNQNLLVLGCSVRKTLEGLYHLKTYETRYETLLQRAHRFRRHAGLFQPARDDSR
ncbi:MAG: MBL fold metallo-hydrolase [Blautia sp.]